MQSGMRALAHSLLPLVMLPLASSSCHGVSAGACRRLVLRHVFQADVPPDAPPDVELPGFFGYAAIIPELQFRERRGGAPSAQPDRSRPASEASQFETQGLAGAGVGLPLPTLDRYSLLRYNLTMKTLIFRVQLGPTLVVNSTVFYTLNSTARVPLSYAVQHTLFDGSVKSGPSWRGGAAAAAQNISDTVVLYSHGHEGYTCVPNFDGMPDHLNRLGYDVMELFSALKGCNAHNGVPKQRH